MISRRELLLATLSVLLTGKVMANSKLLADQTDQSVSWHEFESLITELAEENAAHKMSLTAMTKRGLKYLEQLDISRSDFKQAVNASYETGNRFWLWQRMIKAKNINGGILNISRNQMVQLHDHPGATGLVRIISGEAEVWQFDEMPAKKASQNDEARESHVELFLVSHRILKPGDMAVLTPEKGNIHALISVTNECSMLDFFIPPYKQSQRSWYEPLEKQWFDKTKIACKKNSAA